MTIHLMTTSLTVVLPIAAALAQQKAVDQAAAPRTKADLKAILAEPVLESDTTLREVQAFVEPLIPVMPKVGTAAEWDALAERLRKDVLDKVVLRGQAARWRDARCRVVVSDRAEDGPGYRIFKLRYEALPGMWIPAVLYLPEKIQEPAPVALCVNGHDGNGTAALYKQLRCINLVKRGLIVLNVEWFGMGQLKKPGYNHYRMNQLDLCGTSGLAPFYLALKRGIDVLVSTKGADAERVSVSGLSGGGWQTIFISALDTRVTLSNPVAGYSSFKTRVRFLKDLGDSEQMPCDLATVVDYAHLTAMVSPRPLLLTFNAKDNCCFEAGYALPPLLEAARPIYELHGKPANLRSHVNHDPGNHNFGLDNRRALYRMTGDHFFPGDPKYEPEEFGSEPEVRTAAQLAVPLPADNHDFTTLATALAADLPREPDLPTSRAAAGPWRAKSLARLREIVKFTDSAAVAEPVGRQTVGELEVQRFRLKIDKDWTVPAVVLQRGDPTGTALLIADEGRVGAAAQVERLLTAGRRVVAVDPFYFGESKIAERDFLFALLVASVGRRPLGIQAGQVAAAARWAAQAYPASGPMTLVAVGPRAGTFGLIASALEERAIGRVELHRPPGSLKELIEQGGSVDKTPELFCFGLLEAFDIRQIAALTVPRPISVTEPSERAGREWAPLRSYYGVWHDPLP